MDRKLRERIFSLILAFGFVFPMIIGFTHALHEHDQQVCLAQNESHIHSKGIDCDHEHYFNPGGVIDQTLASEKLISVVMPIAIWGSTCPKANNFISNLTLRGPPMINV